MQAAPVQVQALAVELATPGNVAPYGTLLEPGEDGTPFGDVDARLELSRGIPRFYIMALTARPLRVEHITRHLQVTQCLAAMEGQDWIIVMAPPGDLPDATRIRALRFTGTQALCMHAGTWHAGPLLLQPACNFLNLELSDTNTADHHTVRLEQAYSLAL